MIKEGRRDPGGLAGDETKDVLIGLLLIPALGILLWLALMFILGFTTLLGGPMGFFKFIFILSLIGTVVLGTIVRKLLGLVRRGTKQVVDKTIEGGRAIRDAHFRVEKEEDK